MTEKQIEEMRFTTRIISRLFNISDMIMCCKLECSASAGFLIDGRPHCLAHMLSTAKRCPWTAS